MISNNSNNWRHGRWSSLIYEFAVFSFFAFTLYVETNTKIPYVSSNFGGRWKYLTFWNFLFQIIYFFICFARTLTNSNKDNYYWSIFSAGIVFPLCILVNVVFWVLYFIDREIILPKALDAYYPSWINHVQHTAIVPVLLCQRYLTKVQYPSAKSGISITMTFAAIYLIWIAILAHYNGTWVYPFLDVLDLKGKVIFFILSGLLLVIFYFIGEYVNKLFWGKESKGSDVVKSGNKVKKYN